MLSKSEYSILLVTAPQFFYENQFRIDRPAGDSKFIKKIEKLIGKTFNFNKQCRPKRKNMIDDEYRKQGFRVFGQTEDGVCLGEFLKQTPSGHDLKDRKIFKLGRFYVEKQAFNKKYFL